MAKTSDLYEVTSPGDSSTANDTASSSGGSDTEYHQQRKTTRSSSISSSTSKKRKVGRPKSSNSEDKRIQRNRRAQQAFRDRKLRYVAELEDKVKQLDDNTKLITENEELRSRITFLENENMLLKAASFQVPPQIMSPQTSQATILSTSTATTTIPSPIVTSTDMCFDNFLDASPLDGSSSSISPLAFYNGPLPYIF